MPRIFSIFLLFWCFHCSVITNANQSRGEPKALVNNKPKHRGEEIFQRDLELTRSVLCPSNLV